MMNKMIVANLVHRPLRSLISIVAIALEVTLILLIVGLCYGIMNDTRQRQAGMGAEVVPVVMQFSSAGTLEIVWGIDQKSFERLGGPFRYLSGGPFQGEYDALVDDVFARSQHVKAGDTIELLNHKFHIAGVVEHGRGSRKFLPMATLQNLMGAQGKVSAFYLKLD